MFSRSDARKATGSVTPAALSSVLFICSVYANELILRYMDIPFSSWHRAITERRSRRHFDINRPIEPETLAALDTICKQFRPFPHARSRLVTESGKGIFKGAIGSYGKIKDAPAFIAFIGDMNSPSVQEEVGYTGEGIIL